MNQRLQTTAVEHRGRDPVAEVRQGTERPIAIAGGDQLTDRTITKVANGGKAEQDPIAVGGEIGERGIHIRGHHLNPHRIAIGDVALHFVGSSGVHREQGRHVSDRVVRFQVSRLVSNGAIGRGMALVEAVFSEENHLIEQFVGDLFINAALSSTLNEDAAVLLHLGHFFLAHRPPEQIGLTQGVTGQILRDPHDLFLVHHDPVGLGQDRLKNRVGEVDRLPAVLAVDEFGNQASIERPRSVEGKDRGDVFQG